MPKNSIKSAGPVMDIGISEDDRSAIAAGLSRLLAVGDVNKEGVPEQRSVGLAQRPPYAVNPFAAARGRDDAPLPKPVGKVAS